MATTSAVSSMATVKAAVADRRSAQLASKLLLLGARPSATAAYRSRRLSLVPVRAMSGPGEDEEDPAALARRAAQRATEETERRAQDMRKAAEEKGGEAKQRAGEAGESLRERIGHAEETLVEKAKEMVEGAKTRASEAGQSVKEGAERAADEARSMAKKAADTVTGATEDKDPPSSN